MISKKLYVIGRDWLSDEDLQKNPAYGQHSDLSYVCDSGVPILYHESKVNTMGVVNTLSPCLYYA